MLEQHILKSIIEEWSFWNGRVYPASIPRDIEMPDALLQDVVLIIQGVRRCGKSTLLTQLPQLYNLDADNCYFCNFEDPRLLGHLDHTLLESIVKLAEHLRPGKKHYFFFDEIQNVENWEKWLHAQLERPKNRYFTVSGSNSSLLSGEFATALTGRHLTIELYPFSFSEYKKIHIDNNLQAYLQQGGFPRAVQLTNTQKLLQEYFNDIILRDVQKRVHARNADAIKQVVKMAFDTCGSELSYRKIAAICGLTTDTVKLYLDACEQAYLLFSCEYFAFSAKKRLIRNKKFYPIDFGLRTAVSIVGSKDLGKSLEQLTFLRLKQLFGKVYYWSAQGEVDFVVMNDRKIIPFQVSWEKEQERHYQALQAFYNHFPQAEDAVFINQETILNYL